MQQMMVSQVARDITARTGHTVSPQVVANLFYRRQLDDERCPIVGRFRLIPRDYIPEIEAVLRTRGLLPEDGAAKCKSHSPDEMRKTAGGGLTAIDSGIETWRSK